MAVVDIIEKRRAARKAAIRIKRTPKAEEPAPAVSAPEKPAVAATPEVPETPAAPETPENKPKKKYRHKKKGAAAEVTEDAPAN